MEWWFASAAVLLIVLALLVWWTDTGKFALWFGALIGTIILALLSLITLVKLAGPAGGIIWGGGILAVLTLWVQVRRARHRTLLKLLTLAVEKGIPLPAAVRALAADQSGGLRWSLADLADHLGRGIPLSTAAAMSPGTLSSEAIAAAQMGEATGDLAGALSQLEKSDDARTPTQHTLLQNAFYLAWPAIFIPLVLVFFIVAIVPKLIAIFSDFGVPLPEFTVQMVRLIYSKAIWWPIFALSILLAAAFLYVILSYVGILPLPAIGLGQRFERSRVLRGLALATGAGRPLGETLAVLARSYPVRSIGRRMEVCAQEIAAGNDWIASLTTHRLIGQRDAAVVESAQRVGNLPWALRELADSNERRLIHRLDAAINVIAPLILLGWGAVILAFVVAFFSPLATLIASQA